MIARILPAIAALFLVAIVTFVAGMWATYKNWWSWQKLSEVQSAWRSYRATGLILPGDSYTRRKPDVPDVAMTIHDPAAADPGYWVINRYDPFTKTYVLDLFDPEGKLVNTRPIDYSKLVKDGNPGEFAHIATMLPDGSVIVVWDDAKGMARLDACGEPVWALTDAVYHHSLEKGDDGYWTWRSAIWNGGEDQQMVRFDPETGKILESIDLIDDVIAKSRGAGLAMKAPEGFKFDRTTHYGERADIFHPNDLEELTAAMAPAFPMFNAGDLLFSMRNIDMVGVLDRKTHAIKWAAYGPWQHQHDADFLADGTISVFSNNTDRFRSTLVRVDPATGAAEDVFAGKDLSFDSFIMGKEQLLPNGNWMIVSTMQGRVMEVTPAGKIVKEFNNILDDGYNAIAPYAEWHAPGYLTSVPQCAPKG